MIRTKSIGFLVCLLLVLPVLAWAAGTAALILPADLLVIEDEAFLGDTSLDAVVFDDGLTAIRDRAFAESSVKTVSMPASVTEIAENAFENSTLEKISAPEGSYAYAWAKEHGYLKSGPKILVQPRPAKGAAGDTVTFQTEVEGDDVTYQWVYRKTGREWHPAPNGNGPVLTLTATDDLIGSSWKCIVQDAAGGISETDVVRLNRKEITRLTWVTGNSPKPIDSDLVMEELNKITREALGVEVEILYMSSDEIMTATQAGKVYDMYFTCSWFNPYDENVANGVFTDLNLVLEDVAPDLYDTMPASVWNLAKDGDHLYALPVKKDYAPMNFIVYDAQFAKEQGISVPESIQSWDDLTPYLVALKSAMEKDPSLGSYPVYIAEGPSGIDASFEYIDRSLMIGVRYGDTKIMTVLDDPEVVSRYRTMRKWYLMGLVNPDAAFISSDDIDNHLHHISFVQAWNDYDYTPSRGFQARMTKFAGPYLTADGVQGAMNGFSSSLANDPERLALAIKYQEFVNTNRKYRDILAFGIEGVHFNYHDIIDENGNPGRVVVRTELGRSNYSPWRFTQGSYASNTLEVSESYVDGTYTLPSVNQWDAYFSECETAAESKIDGFTFDFSSPIDFTEARATFAAIKEEYLKEIQCGMVDPDAAISEMKSMLIDAGLNDVLAEAQRQLDAHLMQKEN